MSEPDFQKELELQKHNAAEFLRELADSIEDDKDLFIEGDGWELFQPYENKIPLRVTQDEFGIEVDIKILDPMRER